MMRVKAIEMNTKSRLLKIMRRMMKTIMITINIIMEITTTTKITVMNMITIAMV